MTDLEKIVPTIKEYLLKTYSEGYSTHQNMVLALKNGIDYFVGRKDKLESIKNEILSTCLSEFDLHTKIYIKAGHIKMAKAIRLGFVQFVNELNVSQLREVSNYHFERRINNKESERLLESLKIKFDFGAWKDENYYWEPLSKTKNTTPLIYFEDEFLKSNEVDQIVNIVKSISGERIYYLTDAYINYEVETSSFNFEKLESAYCNYEADWLIYISHEGTIAFSGQKLVTEIENKMPEIFKLKNP